MPENSHRRPESERDGLSRRRFFGVLAAACPLGFAGCSGNGDGPDTESSLPTEGDQVTPTTQSQSTATATPAEQSTPTTPSGTPTQSSIDDATRERIAEVGRDIRPSVALLETLDSRRPVVGLFFDTSLVVTSASAIEVRDEVALQSVQTRDGETQDFTVLGRTTTSDNSEDLAALRVDLEAPVLPEGSAEALSAGDIVVQVGYTSALEWITQFGRIKRFTDDGRFVTSLPFQTPGGPVATLDGTLVGITTQSGEFDTPANEAPPPTAPETVYTDQSQWAGIRQEPISDVRAQVDEWTS